MPDPIEIVSGHVDLSQRFKRSTTIVGSPAAAAETTIASLTITEDIVVVQGIQLVAWCAFTVGTSGVSANLKLHHTDSSGATLAATGAVDVTAAKLVTSSVHGFDAVPVLPGQVYIATLTIGSGAAVSTVSGVFLGAIII